MSKVFLEDEKPKLMNVLLSYRIGGIKKILIKKCNFAPCTSKIYEEASLQFQLASFIRRTLTLFGEIFPIKVPLKMFLHQKCNFAPCINKIEEEAL